MLHVVCARVYQGSVSNSVMMLLVLISKLIDRIVTGCDRESYGNCCHQCMSVMSSQVTIVLSLSASIYLSDGAMHGVSRASLVCHWRLAGDTARQAL